MKYPILQLDVCQQIVRDLVENEGSTNADIDGAVLWEGNGKKVNLDTFKERLSIVVEWENHVKEYGDNSRIHLIEHGSNRGYGAALRSGFGGVWGFPQARLDARQKVSAHDLNAASRPEKGLKVTGGRSMP